MLANRKAVNGTTTSSSEPRQGTQRTPLLACGTEYAARFPQTPPPALQMRENVSFSLLDLHGRWSDSDSLWYNSKSQNYRRSTTPNLPGTLPRHFGVRSFCFRVVGISEGPHILSSRPEPQTPVLHEPPQLNPGVEVRVGVLDRVPVLEPQYLIWGWMFVFRERVSGVF